MSENLILDVVDAIDLHLHSGPSLFQRPFTDVDSAEMAKKSGMQAILLKDHFESTASRAYHTRRQVTGIQIFGGIAMNRYVGGLNPVVAETALGFGAKAVWMPTIDSARQVDVYGATSSYELKGELRGPRASSKTAARLSTKEGLTILKDGKLKEEVKDIVKVTMEYDAMLGTGHLFRDEVFELVKFARSMKHNKMVVTHAEAKVCGLTKEEIKDLSDLGGIIEVCATIAGPPTYWMTIEKVKQILDLCGPGKCIISSDAGMPCVPCGPEALRSFAQCLYEKGIPVSDLKLMMIENPKRLLSL
jgi:hypothetical protein